MRYDICFRARLLLAAGAILATTFTGRAALAEATLAQVGGEAISASEFAAFRESVPEVYTKGRTGFSADSLLLETLVDKKALLQAVSAAGIEKEPWFEPAIVRFHKQQVLFQYKLREISKKVVITEEDMERQWRETNRDRALRFAGILLPTREDAMQVLEEVAAGADYADLARERSLYDGTRDYGGDIGRYLTKDATSGAIRDVVSTMQVDEITPEPLLYWYKGNKNFLLVKILDEVPAPIWESEDILKEEVFGRKRAEREAMLQDSLWREYDPQIQHGTAAEILRRAKAMGADTTEAGFAPETVLCTYRGGQIRVVDPFYLAPRGKRSPRDFADSTAFVSYLRESIIPAQLHLEEAELLGYHEDPGVVAKVEKERQDQLVSTLRKRQVDADIAVSEEEARVFFDEHPELFLTLDEIGVVEVLVTFKKQAAQIKTQIEDGADPEQLATDYTSREGMGHHGGRLTLKKASLYPELYEAARELEVGAVVGPLKVKGGYSVFKITDRSPRQVKPYHEHSQRRARAFVRMTKSNRAYAEYVRGLREQYPVKVFWDELASLSSP